VLDSGIYSFNVHAEVPSGFGDDLAFTVNVSDACINLTITHKPIVDHYYKIGSGSQYIYVDDWEVSHPQCGDLGFTATYDDGSAFPIP
jgi:hypothetical protein